MCFKDSSEMIDQGDDDLPLDKNGFWTSKSEAYYFFGIRKTAQICFTSVHIIFIHLPAWHIMIFIALFYRNSSK